MLIVFDGPNCSGKTTLLKNIAAYLQKKYSVYLTREPTNDSFGEKLREIEDKYESLTYLFLIAANRSEHNFKEIIPNQNKIILCDRYIASSLALQHYKGLSLDLIWDINKYFTQPDISFFISASDSELDKRLNLRVQKTYFEKVLSRNQEISLYKNAYEYMKKKLCDVYWFENDEANYEVNYNKIIQIIEAKIDENGK